MRSVIKLSQLLYAKFNTLMKSTHVTVILLWRRKLCLESILAHLNVISLKKTVKIFVADLMMNQVLILIFNFNTHVLDDRIHVVLTDELRTNFETGAVFESTVKIVWAHYFIVLIHMTAFGYVLVHIFNYNRVRWTNLEFVNFSAFAQENLDRILVTNLNPWFHCDALAIPKCVQIWLAKPLVATFDMMIVLGFKLHTLVVLDVAGELLKGGHSVAK